MTRTDNTLNFLYFCTFLQICSPPKFHHIIQRTIRENKLGESANLPPNKLDLRSYFLTLHIICWLIIAEKVYS